MAILEFSTFYKNQLNHKPCQIPSYLSSSFSHSRKLNLKLLPNVSRAKITSGICCSIAPK